MKIPGSIRFEHESLHRELADVSLESGKVGEAARSLAQIMHPHFLREDEYAMPPLGLLARLARNELSPDMAEALPLVARLKEELPLMIEEHRAIKGALARLETVAAEDGKTEIVDFAKRLALHARTEEEILYPAAILVGEILKQRLATAAAAAQS
ncbi:MAG TPA: hemerythrin domain-containing protein [Gemmatimonadales bacterium]|nr:hemerythrin domain-containing protein [Gemmatimonadales bacterium]